MQWITWIILLTIYFLIGMYVSASYGSHCQHRLVKEERLGRTHKMIAVLFGIFWIVFIPLLVIWFIGLIKNRKEYIFLLNGEIMCRKCGIKFSRREILGLDEFYYKLPICNNCAKK